MSNWNSYFEKHLTRIKVPDDIQAKVKRKHKVNKEDIEDALGDGCWVVRKFEATKPDHMPWDGELSGDTFEIFCEDSSGRLYQVRGRLYYPGTGHFVVFTILAGKEISAADRHYHIKEKEEVCYE